MIHKKRLSISIIASTIVEIFNKLVPLFIIFFVKSKLGIESFGYAQFGISFVEMSIPIVTFGYVFYGSIQIGKHRDDHQKIGEIMSDLLTLKILHAVVAFTLLIGSTYLIPSYAQYRPMFLAASFIIFFAALDMIWVHLGVQKMAIVSLFVGSAKIVGLALILAFVQNPADAILYVVLFFMSNATISMLSFLYCTKHFPLSMPSWQRMRRIFYDSRIFALLALISILTDRVDILVVEHYFGLEGVGLYAIPFRVNSSILHILAGIVAIFLSEMVIIRNKEIFTKHVAVAVWLLMSIMTPIAFGVWFVDSPLLALIFGSDYYRMGPVLSVMVLTSIATIATGVFGMQILMLRKRESVYTKILLFGLVTSIIATVTLVHIWGFLGVALGIMLSKYISALLAIYNAKPFIDRYPIKEFLSATMPGFLMGAVLYFAATDNLLQIFTLALISYLIFFSIFNYKYFIHIWNLIKNRKPT